MWVCGHRHYNLKQRKKVFFRWNIDRFVKILTTAKELAPLLNLHRNTLTCNILFSDGFPCSVVWPWWGWTVSCDCMAAHYMHENVQRSRHSGVCSFTVHSDIHTVEERFMRTSIYLPPPTPSTRSFPRAFFASLCQMPSPWRLLPPSCSRCV